MNDQPNRDQITTDNNPEETNDEATKDTLPAPAGAYAEPLKLDINVPLDEEPNKSALSADVMTFCEGGHELLLHEIEGLERDPNAPDAEDRVMYRSALACGIGMVRWLEATAAAMGVDCDARFISKNINSAFKAVRDTYRMLAQLQPIAQLPMEHFWSRKDAYLASTSIDESCTNPKCPTHHPETAFEEIKLINADPRAPYQGDELLVGTEKHPLTSPANFTIFGDYAMPFNAERGPDAHRAEMLGFEQEAERVSAQAPTVENARATVVVGVRMARMFANVLATMNEGADRTEVIYEALPVVTGYAVHTLLGRSDSDVGVEAMKWMMKYWEHDNLLIDIVKKARQKEKAEAGEALLRKLGMGELLDRMGGRVNVVEIAPGATIISM